MEYEDLSKQLEIALKERDEAMENAKKWNEEYLQKNLQINKFNEPCLRKLIAFYEKRYQEEQEEKIKLSAELAELKVRKNKLIENESKNMEKEITKMNNTMSSGSFINSNELQLLQNKYRSVCADHEKLHEQYKQLRIKYQERAKELEDKITEVLEKSELIDQLEAENARLKQLVQK